MGVDIQHGSYLICDLCQKSVNIVADIDVYGRITRLCASCVATLYHDTMRAEHEQYLREMKALYEASKPKDDPCNHGDRM